MFSLTLQAISCKNKNKNVLSLTSTTSIINNTSDITGQTFFTYSHHNYIICSIP